MNYIVGSGLVGMLAKHILGNGWEFIPQKKSRYYSFEPVLADNFIVVNDAVGEVLNSIYPFIKDRGIIYFKRAFSIAGELTYQESQLTADPYLEKVYGVCNGVMKSLLKSGFFIYNIEAKRIHDQLQETMMNSISGSNLKEVVSIDLKNRSIVAKNGGGADVKVDFDKLVITSPLDATYKWCGIQHPLSSQNVCYYYIESDQLDLEEADQVLVCDGGIDFFKVDKFDKCRYLFWTFDKIENPYEYFGAFIGYKLNIIESFRIEAAIPTGPVPSLKEFEDNQVYCVGSNAQWDDFMDLSSSLSRLVKINGKIH